MDHEPEMVTKKKRRLVLGSELDVKIKDLYEKYVSFAFNLTVCVLNLSVSETV